MVPSRWTLPPSSGLTTSEARQPSFLYHTHSSDGLSCPVFYSYFVPITHVVQPLISELRAANPSASRSSSVHCPSLIVHCSSGILTVPKQVSDENLSCSCLIVSSLLPPSPWHHGCLHLCENLDICGTRRAFSRRSQSSSYLQIDRTTYWSRHIRGVHDLLPTSSHLPTPHPSPLPCEHSAFTSQHII